MAMRAGKHFMTHPNPAKGGAGGPVGPRCRGSGPDRFGQKWQVTGTIEGPASL